MHTTAVKGPTGTGLKRNVVLFGTGSIGGEFRSRAEAIGCHFIASINTKGATGDYPITFRKLGDAAETLAYTKELVGRFKIDVAVFAMPSGTDGTSELALMLVFLQLGIPVVTAGKAVLAQHYDALRPYLHLIGWRAAVGGGTGMLYFARDFLKPGPCSIRGVLNGTMANMSWRISTKWTLEEAAQEAIKLKYAEKQEGTGPLSLQKVYEPEITDVAQRKIPAAVSGLLLASLGRGCKPDDIHVEPFDEAHLREFVRHNGRADYVVDFGIGEAPPNDGRVPGAIWADLPGGIYVRGAFSRLERDDPLSHFLPDGPGNALVVRQETRTLHVGGLGAGPLPTVDAMMEDFEEMVPPVGSVTVKATSMKEPEPFERRGEMPRVPGLLDAAEGCWHGSPQDVDWGGLSGDLGTRPGLTETESVHDDGAVESAASGGRRTAAVLPVVRPVSAVLVGEPIDDQCRCVDPVRDPPAESAAAGTVACE